MTVVSRAALVLAPTCQGCADLCDILQQQSWLKGRASGDVCSFRGKGLALRMEFAETVEEAVSMIGSGYYNIVVIDCRDKPGREQPAAPVEETVGRFLDALRRGHDRELRYPFRRIVVLVGGEDEERVDRLTFAMGKRQVGACIRDASLSRRSTDETRAHARARFVDQLWSFCRQILVERRRGKKAINAAGGGITGIYYELGVLKCLQDSFSIDIRDFDLYYGISAGALVAAGLANRFDINELIARFGRLKGDWPYRLQLGWRHLNVGEVPRRLMLAQRELVDYVMRMVKRQDEFSVASILGTSTVVLGPIFDNTEFEEALRRLFSEEGHSNDFRELPHKLYIGATDQDRREGVLFGSEGFRDVPISKAIQASASWHPFFPSVQIRGRYYTDGIVTRTSNIRAAVDEGADLIFVLDPFVPLISEQPGFNARHGNMWIVEQDYKTMSYTRYEQARNELLRRKSEVSIYTFVPGNRMRHLMASQNPFVAKNFDVIVCEAYRSTHRRLRQLEHKLSGELASHGIEMDPGPAERKVEALRIAKKPDVRLLLDDGPSQQHGSDAA